MGGVGSGRRPKVVNGTNGHATAQVPTGPRVTLGDLLAKINAPAAPPPGMPPGSSQGVASVPPAAPPAPIERPANRSFAQMAGYIATNVGVNVIGDHLRKQGLRPRDVAAEDLDRTSKATEDAIVRAIGDAEIPWWAGLVAAWGNLYLAMRVGAEPLPKKEKAPPGAETTTNTTTPAPASPLGHGNGASAPPPAPPNGLRPIRVFE